MQTIIVIILVCIALKFLVKKKRAKPSKWEKELPEAKYTHYFRKTGIAVDPENKKIHLMGTFRSENVRKSYQFEDIRSWSGIEKTGGVAVASRGLQQGAQNALIRSDNERATGLFVKVRDIDYPEWQILFRAGRDRRMELSRWEEILSQFVEAEAS